MGLRFEVDDAESLEPLVARWFFENGFSREFRDLLLAIEGMVSRPILYGNAPRWPHIDVPIQLSLKCHCGSCQGNALKHFEEAETCFETKKILSSILRVARVQRHDVEYRHRPEMVMKIDAVEFASGHDTCTVESHGVMLLGRLVECGINVRELPAIAEYFSVDLDFDASNVHVTRALRVLLAATGTPQPSEQTGLRRLTISGLTSFSYTRAVLSAVQQSQSLQHVIVEDLVGIGDAADRNMYWRWVAFGLVSPFATHQIQTLELRLPQWCMGDVIAIHSILAADNFLSLLEGTTKQPTLLRSKTFHLGRFAGDDESQLVLYTSDTPIDIWLFDETDLDDQWMKVLLPGSEMAWVRRDEVEVLGPPKYSGSAMKARLFPTTIVRGVPQGAMRTITALLRFIGHSVKRLEIRGVEYDDVEGDEWNHQLLLECPRLEELRIESSEIRHLSPLLECLLSSKRRLRRLKIDSVHNRRCGDIGAFFRALYDLNDPLTPSLEELDVNVGCVRRWPTMTAIEVMVAKHTACDLFVSTFASMMTWDLIITNPVRSRLNQERLRRSTGIPWTLLASSRFSASCTTRLARRTLGTNSTPTSSPLFSSLLATSASACCNTPWFDCNGFLHGTLNLKDLHDVAKELALISLGIGGNRDQHLTWKLFGLCIQEPHESMTDSTGNPL